MIGLIAAQLVPFLDSSTTPKEAASIGWRIASDLLLEACPQDDKRKIALQDLLNKHDTLTFPGTKSI